MPVHKYKMFNVHLKSGMGFFLLKANIYNQEKRNVSRISLISLEIEGNLYFLLLEIKVKDLFQTLSEKEYIEKEKDSWSLTQKGKDAGGIVKSHPQYGSYCSPPDSRRTGRFSSLSMAVHYHIFNRQ